MSHNGMHPSANNAALIENLPLIMSNARRVMPGVMLLSRAVLPNDIDECVEKRSGKIDGALLQFAKKIACRSKQFKRYNFKVNTREA
jgi:hypothetical protein